MDGVIFSCKQKSRKAFTVIVGFGLLLSACCPSALAVPLQPEQPVYCTSKECLQSAASLMWSINKTVDPCDNFYKHVCGTPGAFTYGHKNGMVELALPMKMMVHNFIKKFPNVDDPLPIKMVRKFYTACIVDEDINFGTLSRHLRSAGLPSIPSLLSYSGSQLTEVDWVEASVTMKKLFDVDLFVSWDVEENVFGTGHVLYINALGTPDSRSNAYLTRIRRESSIKDVIQEVLRSGGHVITESRLSKAAKIIYAMTFRNPTLVKNDGDIPNIKQIARKMKKITVGNLQNLTDSTFKVSGIGKQKIGQSWKSWIELLVSSITGTTIKVTNEQEVYYLESSLTRITEIHSYLSKQKSAEIELYAWYKAVMAIVKDSVMGDGKRAEYCTELTETHLNTALGFGIIPKEFITDVKPEVVELLDYFKETFAEHIEKSDLLDLPTKRLAVKKIKSLTYAVGAPDWIKNETAVLRTYENVTINILSHLDNVLSITRASVKNTFNQFIHGYDENHNRETNVKISSMSTYYNVVKNFISIPWAILHSPVYHLGLRSLNYGALGSVIGHEITHGFDEDGIHFDQDANYKRWWSSSAIKKYKKSTECFVKQYSNFTVTMGSLQLPVDANQTLNENIADNVGIKIAYYALQKALKKETEQKLPGFENYSGEKLFFLSNAHIWCGELDEASFMKQLLQVIDEHSPRSHRVNGPMQNFGAFSEAFNCPLGSNMNPDRVKCSVW